MEIAPPSKHFMPYLVLKHQEIPVSSVSKHWYST